MTQQDINTEQMQKLANLMAGGRLAVRTNPESPVVDIKIDGIPLEVSIPAIVNVLAEFMEYSVQLWKEQQEAEDKEKEKEDDSDGISDSGCSSCEIGG